MDYFELFSFQDGLILQPITLVFPRTIIGTIIVGNPELMTVWFSFQGTFGREPQARPEDDRYLRAAIQEYDNIAKLGQIMREGPIKVRRIKGSKHAETLMYVLILTPINKH